MCSILLRSLCSDPLKMWELFTTVGGIDGFRTILNIWFRSFWSSLGLMFAKMIFGRQSRTLFSLQSTLRLASFCRCLKVSRGSNQVVSSSRTTLSVCRISFTSKRIWNIRIQGYGGCEDLTWHILHTSKKLLMVIETLTARKLPLVEDRVTLISRVWGFRDRRI